VNRWIDDEDPARARNETHLERADRNLAELLQELRVVAIGVQVLLGFLLIVPFNSGFSRVTGAERYLYLAVLVTVAVAAGLMIAPTSLHRLIFRQGDKQYLVETGNQLAILGIICLTVAMTGILAFITGLLFGWIAGVVGAVISGIFYFTCWWGVGLRRRRHLRERRGRRRLHSV
jgi:protein-S-isoprenylcysteine O-methyltransferase Ste14